MTVVASTIRRGYDPERWRRTEFALRQVNALNEDQHVDGDAYQAGKAIKALQQWYSDDQDGGKRE